MIKYRRLKICLTEGCPLNCKHCYLGTKFISHADADMVIKRILEAQKLGVQILDLTGGEPTIHPDFCKILEVAGRSNFKRINLSTNGLNLSQKGILSLLEIYKVHCNISMDGATELSVNTIRGQNVFSRLEKILTILNDRGIYFSLRFSINAINMNEVDKILNYAKKWGVSADLEPTQLIGNASKKVLLSNAEMLMVKQTIAISQINLSNEVNESFTKPCACDGGFSDLLSLNVRGIGVSCLMITHGKQFHGSVNELSLKDMWELIQAEKQRIRDFRSEFVKCLSCQYHDLCQSGCLVTAFSLGCFAPLE